MEPHQDRQGLTHPRTEAKQLLADGQVDAFLGFPPTQELRLKQSTHVVLNSTADRPWWQYFRCLVTGNRPFVHTYPVASARGVRAILKAAALCAREPVTAAQLRVHKGDAPQQDSALPTLQELAYAQWRDYDPEDTIHFYALRLHEAGMIKSARQRLIVQGSDGRFLNELSGH